MVIWKIRVASTGFEPMTSALPVTCSINCDTKPHSWELWSHSVDSTGTQEYWTLNTNTEEFMKSELNAQQNDVIPTEWLYRSVGKALDWHRSRGHGFESRWSHPVNFSGICKRQLPLKLSRWVRRSLLPYVHNPRTSFIHFFYSWLGVVDPSRWISLARPLTFSWQEN